MSLDDRLRAGLHGDASHVEPDVDRHLSMVMRRSRRRQGVVPTSALALVIVAAGGVVLGGLLLDRSGPTTPAASVAPVDPADALVGTYRAHLDDAAGASEPSLLGDWELAFAADSSVALVAPASFETDASLGGYAYTLIGDSLITSLLTRQFGHDCASPGSYRWDLSEGRLALEIIDDTCPERRTILTGATWTRVGS